MMICIAFTAALFPPFLAKGQMRAAPADTLIRDARQSLGVDKRTSVFDVRVIQTAESLTLKGTVQSTTLRDSLIDFLRTRWNGTIIDSLHLLPQPVAGSKTWAVTSVSVANIRTRPDHAEEMATQVLLGSPLRILEVASGWLRIQTVEGYLGWTDDLVMQMDEAAFNAWQELPKVIVTAIYGFTHEAPDQTSQVVSDIVVGDIFWLKADKGEFFEVGYPDGRVAFLRKEEGRLLQTWVSERAPAPESIVATAKQFLGIPYLWGGTSAKGLDCSGFCKTVYFLNGILLPRDADQQSLIGDPVDTSDEFSHVQAGDLLFFGAKASGSRKERVTHVGISLGGSRFIHESTDVHYNSLDPKAGDYSEFRREGLIRIRRVLGSSNGLRFLKDLSYYQTHGL